MRFCKRRYLIVVALVLTTWPAVSSFATEPTIEAAGSYGSFYWNPSTADIGEHGSAAFKNMTSVSHGIVWHSIPGGAQAPVCGSGVPVYNAVGEGGQVNWSGSCSFTQAGTYVFYCSVHGSSMTGTITVQAPSTPKAVTNEQTGVTQTDATLNGTVKPEGTATSYYFAYGTTSAMTEKIPVSPQSAGSDFAEHAVSASLTSLLPNTEYHFELVATYGASGNAEGVERVFTTLPPPEAPRATTGLATGVKETEATLGGTVDPDWEATKYFFEYGATVGYGQKTETKSLTASGSNQPVAIPLTQLTSGTEYHFRLVAENGQGRNIGSDGTFTTASSPPPKTEPPAKEPTQAGTTSTPSVIASVLPKPEEKLATLGPPFAAGSLKLSALRHGSSVHGSLDVASSGAGGTFEVDLLAKTASLAKVRHSKSSSTRVGRLVRRSVSAGKLNFSVSLSARAKSALRRHHKLALTVKITLTPPSGAPEVLKRLIVVRG